MSAGTGPVGAPGGFDVAVVGGGPAGAAVAIALARSGAAVVLLERGDGAGNPVGESLPPSATPLLQRLGAWEAVAATQPVAIHANRSVWGSPEPQERDFLREPYGPGWRVDRPAFNAALLAEAEQAGAVVLRHARVRGLLRDGSCWRLNITPADADIATVAPRVPWEVRARFVVDATGRGVTIARLLGARRVPFERLAGAVAVLPPVGVVAGLPEAHGWSDEGCQVGASGWPGVAAPGYGNEAPPGLSTPGVNPARSRGLPIRIRWDSSLQNCSLAHAPSSAPDGLRSRSPGLQPRATPNPDRPTHRDTATLVEATRDGWWYSGLLPSGALVVAFFSAPAILAATRAWHPDGWQTLLRSTGATRERAAAFALPFTAPTIAAAGMARLDRAAGDGWLAVGDAAACHDPLTSHGIGHALHHGPLAAATILAHLAGDAAALPDWADRVAADHGRCHALLRAVYAMETRWPTSPFWRSRADG